MEVIFQADKDVSVAHMKEGQPQLTMTSISSLEDLGPFFASICNNVTRQQTRTKTSSPRVSLARQTSIGVSSQNNADRDEAMEVINALIERDFLEHLQSENQIKT